VAWEHRTPNPTLDERKESSAEVRNGPKADARKPALDQHRDQRPHGVTGIALRSSEPEPATPCRFDFSLPTGGMAILHRWPAAATAGGSAAGLVRADFHHPREICMNHFSIRFAGLLAVAALALAFALVSTARSQVQTTPNFLPFGVASSGNSTTAWFHEPASGRAMACLTTPSAGTLSPIVCVTVKLPRAEP
jgi:hypothetical protein